MLTYEIYTQFCDFWTAYRPADKYANRRSCTFSQWLQRSPPARSAMLRTALNGSVNPDRNPFFWVQDYPEPVPKDYNGTAKAGSMLDNGEAAIALYKGKAGIYTLEDISLYNMQVRQ